MNTIIKYIKGRLDKDLPVNITFLGDSITSTEWIHPNFREITEYVLKNELSKSEKGELASWNIRTFNCGFDGSTTRDILERLENYVLPLQTNILFYEIGVNDGAYNVPIEEFNQNIHSILEKLNGIDNIYLLTPPYSLSESINKRYEPYKEKVENLSRELGIELIDLNKYFKQLDLSKIYTFKSEGNVVEGISEGQIDPEHPNILGNAYIAKYILEKFDIEFDPEKYSRELGKGLKYPVY